MSDVPPIEAVILTWNSDHEIERCLETLSVAMVECGRGGMIHVIDNGSTDNTLKVVEVTQAGLHGVEIRPHAMGVNAGTTVSRNFALRQARAPFVLVADSDTEFLPGSVKAMVDRMKATPHAGLVAPQLYYPNGEEQENCRRFPTAKTKILRTLVARTGRGERFRFRDESYGPTPLRPVDCAISACWLLRHQAVEQVGYLDENIFYSPEDTDYCLRLRLGGWKVIWDRQIKVVHHTKRLSHKGFFNSHARSHASGLRYFWRKHGFFWRRKNLYARFPEAPPETPKADPESVIGAEAKEEITVRA